MTGLSSNDYAQPAFSKEQFGVAELTGFRPWTAIPMP